MSDTKIEWATKVWNPFTGCSPASPGCDNCYAKPFAERMKLNPNAKVAHKYRNGFKPTFHQESLTEPAKWKKPQRIFVCSMSDLFHEDNSYEDIEQVIDYARLYSQHTFMFLTKRPERMMEVFKYYFAQRIRPYHTIEQNIWLGVTAENQEQADKRIKILLEIPAARRFVSIEPMLGAVDLSKSFSPIYYPEDSDKKYDYLRVLRSPIDWVIVGGETGHKARPVHPDWVRSIMEQCKDTNVPFFFKQWGEFMGDNLPEEAEVWKHDCVNYRDYYLKNKPEGITFRVGKTKAGRLLDGQEWNQIPGVRE